MPTRRSASFRRGLILTFPGRWVVVAGALMNAIAITVAHAQCLKDTRVVELRDGSATLRSFRCKAGTERGRGEIQIEFHRLSESAAGNLLKGESYPTLAKVFGKPRILETAPGKEATLLFERFGTRQTEATCFAFAADVPRGLKGYRSAQAGNANGRMNDCGARVLRYLTFPDQAGLTAKDMPLPRDENAISTTTAWPANWRFFYGTCEGADPISCTKLWRYMSKADVDSYANSLAKSQQEQNPGEEAGRDLSTESKNYLALIQHLTRSGWPEEFIVITGEATQCGGAFEFSFHPRQLILEVMTVFNTSSAEVRLDRIVGVAASGGLRRELLAAASGAVELADVTIAPGERVLVPLRILFKTPPSLEEVFKNPNSAGKVWSKVQSSPPGTVFVEGNRSETDVFKPLRKVRDGFGPPVVPSMEQLVYGPEIAVRGIVVNGQNVLPEEISRNYLELSAGEGYGSCPYLYAWSEGSGEWVRYGKVIHSAIGKAGKLTEEKRLYDFTDRVRLAEEELELSHIDRVTLKVRQAGGTVSTIAPRLPALTADDDVYVRIYAGQSIDVEFDIPDWLDRGTIEETSVVISGYYERYASRTVSSRHQPGASSD